MKLLYHVVLAVHSSSHPGVRKTVEVFKRKLVCLHPKFSGDAALERHIFEPSQHLQYSDVVRSRLHMYSEGGSIWYIPAVAGWYGQAIAFSGLLRA